MSYRLGSLLRSWKEMIRLDLEVDPLLLEMAWKLAREAIEALKGQPDQRFIPADEDDPDLTEAWLDSLRDELGRDFEYLSDLFTTSRFGEEPVEISAESAEGILRASSAVRLWVRNHRLEGVLDEDLETGGVDFDGLEPDVRLAYFTYGLLAYLQESLIGLLDGA